MAKTKEGICKLCGKKKTLTFEHVPPKSAFNSDPVKEISPDNTIKMMTGENGRMPWDFSGLPTTTNQLGEGGYYLCNDCNNNTGAWYISEYVKLANTFHDFITTSNPKVGDACSFPLYDFYPLRIIKAIMTMYCDINDNCMGDEQLRKFLLSKNSSDFNIQKYNIYIYMVSPNMRRIESLSYIQYSQIGGVLISEISSYPIGTILCVDKSDLFLPPGLSLNSFAKYGYNDKCNIEIYGIPYLEINTLFPADFRSKDYFINTKK